MIPVNNNLFVADIAFVFIDKILLCSYFSGEIPIADFSIQSNQRSN